MAFHNQTTSTPPDNEAIRASLEELKKFNSLKGKLFWNILIPVFVSLVTAYLVARFRLGM